MEWANRPVDSIENAQSQVESDTWTDVDVVEVPNGVNDEGKIVASRPVGEEWSVLTK